MFAAAYNPTDRPVLIDDAGRQLAGGEWGPVDTTSEHVKVAADLDRLVIKTDTDLADVDTSHPAHDARNRAQLLEQRRQTYADADADLVRAAAERAGVPLEAAMVDPDGGPASSRTRHKGELVTDLIHVDVDPDAILNPPTPEPSPSADDDAEASPTTSGSTAGRRTTPAARRGTAAPSIPATEE